MRRLLAYPIFKHENTSTHKHTYTHIGTATHLVNVRRPAGIPCAPCPLKGTHRGHESAAIRKCTSQQLPRFQLKRGTARTCLFVTVRSRVLNCMLPSGSARANSSHVSSSKEALHVRVSHSFAIRARPIAAIRQRTSKQRPRVQHA